MGGTNRQVIPATNRRAFRKPDRKALTAHCRAELESYKVPRQFRVVKALPLTATGKLERAPGFTDER